MNILVIDTTTEDVAIALKIGEKEVYFVGKDEPKKHNSVLIPDIDKVLEENSAKLSDIDVFGVVVGPGSFTGIRVGVATVNAFALAQSKKVVEIVALDLPEISEGVPCLRLLDCKHGNYYCALTRNGETSYLTLNESELDNYSDCEKIYMKGVYPKEMLKICAEKALKMDVCDQAKPFYLKLSSAERETGIECP